MKEGDYVEQDATIAIIDRQAYQQQLAQAQAAYSVAESTYQRVNRLYEAKATTLQSREQALAQRDATKAQLELATLQLDWATVKAPVVLFMVSPLEPLITWVQSPPAILLYHFLFVIKEIKLVEEPALSIDGVNIKLVEPSHEGLRV